MVFKLKVEIGETNINGKLSMKVLLFCVIFQIKTSNGLKKDVVCATPLRNLLLFSKCPCGYQYKPKLTSPEYRKMLRTIVSMPSLLILAIEQIKLRFSPTMTVFCLETVKLAVLGACYKHEYMQNIFINFLAV